MRLPGPLRVAALAATLLAATASTAHAFPAGAPDNRWVKAPLPQTGAGHARGIRMVVPAATDPNIVYVGTRAGLYGTADAGAGFTLLPALGANIIRGSGWEPIPQWWLDMSEDGHRGWILATLPYGTSTVRATPTDTLGKTGAASAAALVTIRRVDQTSRRVRYRGAWERCNDPRDLGGSVARSSAGGGSASFAFTGTHVAVVMNAHVAGRATIYVDGTRRSTLRLGSGTRREIVLERAWAQAGGHTIRIVNAGRSAIELDGFIVVG